MFDKAQSEAVTHQTALQKSVVCPADIDLLELIEEGTDETDDSEDENRRRVGSYELFDLTASYTPIKALKFRAGIKNVLDRNPPVSNQIYSFLASYDPNYTDPRGRAFFGSVSYSFK